MSRPSTEAQYLASLVPPSAASTGFGRRSLLRGALAGAGFLGASGLLAACGSSGSSGSSGGAGGGTEAASGTLTFGSNQSDAVPKQAYEQLVAGFNDPNIKITTNTVDHNTFQENINTYLQGKPDDVFTWFAGYRMKFFASQGLAGDLSDVWTSLDGFTDGFRKACTGDDGKQYLVPATYYPWAVFYRPSLWNARGYTVPKTLDELKALCRRMRRDGLTPIGFADKDGWPAMGTFDVLNMRINGYQYHVDLMAHRVPWSDPKVRSVFSTWAELLPYHQADALGRTWQEAATGLQNKKSGMYLVGLFVTEQMTANLNDVDFFTFPEVDPAIGSDALDAPIDGYMMSAKPKDADRSKALLTFFGSKAGGDLLVRNEPTTLVANSQTDVSGYTKLQNKAADVVLNAKNIAQFLDRDTRPDFASTVMIPALQSFLKNPKEIEGLCASLERQARTIFDS